MEQVEAWTHAYERDKKPRSRVTESLFQDREEMEILKQELVGILTRDIGSRKGIPVVMEVPGSNMPLANVNWPAVIRIYHGKDYDSNVSPEGNIQQYTYATGSGTGLVGTNPREFETRKMLPGMELFASKVWKLLLTKTDKAFHHGVKLDHPANTCTLLLFAGSEFKGANGSSLGYHCDCVYNKAGDFVAAQNSQTENTPVVIVTFGNSCTLHMKKQVLLDEEWIDSHPP